MTVDPPSQAATIARGHIRRSWAMMEVARYATAQVPAEAGAGLVDHVAMAEGLRVHVTDAAMLAVMLDRARGAPWHAIARARGLLIKDTRQVYGPLYERWEAGEEYPWHPPHVTGAPTACPDDLAAAAREIDEWYLRVCDPLGRAGFGRAQRPVSSVLAALA